MNDNVRVQRDGTTTTITLTRPEKRNALSSVMMTDLTAALERAGASDTLAVVIAAEGPVFSAGHNFGDLAGSDLRTARELFLLCTRMMNTIQGIPQPVVAKVHALATAAGCQLVASCDLAVAADSAGFALPGGQGGLFCHTPLVAVTRNVGRKRALELALSGDVIDAATAADWGLINSCVPADQLAPTVVPSASRRSTPRPSSSNARPMTWRSKSWPRQRSPKTPKKAWQLSWPSGPRSSPRIRSQHPAAGIRQPRRSTARRRGH